MLRYIQPMSEGRRQGYAFQGPRTPKLPDQERALLDAGCVVVFTDTAPDRTEREDMIRFLRAGDEVVICKPSLIGSGADDTADAVRRIGAAGVSVEVLGCGAKVYTDEAEIRDFAAVALKVARRVNAERLNATRPRAGRRSSLEDMSDDQWAAVRFMWERRVPQRLIVEMVQEVWGFASVDRFAIARRIKAEMTAARVAASPDDETH